MYLDKIIGSERKCFEVSGDSMSPTLSEGNVIICEKVPDWMMGNTAQFYVYVIVTADRIMVKRLFRTTARRFVCISDNGLYPQFLIGEEEIKELWFVKGVLKWDEPTFKEVDVTVVSN